MTEPAGAKSIRNGEVSFWVSGTGAPAAPPTDTLDGDRQFDVAIVGGGMTGLWSAWALSQLAPSLSIGVFEAEGLGFGASGRNGGWLSAKQVGMRSVLSSGRGGRRSLQEIERMLPKAVNDVVDILGADEIDAAHGGWLQVARSASEQRRIQEYVTTARQWGVDEERLRLITARDADAMIQVNGTIGAIYSPDGCSVNPVKMVYRLAHLLRRAGVEIFTSAPVTAIDPGSLVVAGRSVEARHIVIATEGYSARQAGQQRRMLPMNSAALVTEPLTDDQWSQIGWDTRCGLAGSAHTYFYGNRTADGRILFGGRGKPYRYASGFDVNGVVPNGTVKALMATLSDVFPQVQLTAAHAWCGVIGVPRDWSPFIDFDRTSGIVRVGGYVGQGVTASYVAGLIVADVLQGRDSFLASCPWVRPAPRKWEPEPLRWVGATGLYGVYSLADKLEARSASSKQSPLATLASKVAGRS